MIKRKVNNSFLLQFKIKSSKGTVLVCSFVKYGPKMLPQFLPFTPWFSNEALHREAPTGSRRMVVIATVSAGSVELL